MLRQRVLTAIVLLAILAAAAMLGRRALTVVFALLIGAAAFEWLRLAQRPAPDAALGSAVLALALLALDLAASLPAAALAAVLAAACVVWLAIAIVVARGAQTGARVGAHMSAALCVLLLAAAWFGLLRLLDGGLVYLVSAVAIVWIADIAAYFAGRRWGRSKLAPAISPGKTWAGVAGALVAVLAAALAAAALVPASTLFSNELLQRLPTVAALAVLALLVALSIVGDLFESLLKRQVGAKDSGKLLPGHGGVLDRVDALIAVLPAAGLLDWWLRR